MTAKHIAGTPWKVNGSESTTAIWVEDSNGRRVCNIRNCDIDYDRARLIAAAPALLEALITVRDYWAGGDAPEEITRQIHAAINQAEGK